MELSTWVKLARTKQGWTQDQLATALDVTKGNVSAWENGRHEPSWDRILKIGRLTGEPLPIPLELLAPLIKHLSDLTSEKVNPVTAEKTGTMEVPTRPETAQNKGVVSPVQKKLDIDQALGRFRPSSGGARASGRTEKKQGKGGQS